MQEVQRRVSILQMMFQILFENLQLKNDLNQESKNWNHKAKSTKIHFTTDQRIQMYWEINQHQVTTILIIKKTKNLVYLKLAHEEVSNLKMVESQVNRK